MRGNCMTSSVISHLDGSSLNCSIPLTYSLVSPFILWGCEPVADLYKLQEIYLLRIPKSVRTINMLIQLSTIQFSLLMLRQYTHNFIFFFLSYILKVFLISLGNPMSINELIIDYVYTLSVEFQVPYNYLIIIDFYCIFLKFRLYQPCFY